MGSTIEERVTEERHRDFEDDDLMVIQCIADGDQGRASAIHRALVEGDEETVGRLMVTQYREYRREWVERGLDRDVAQRRLVEEQDRRTTAAARAASVTFPGEDR